MNSYDFPGAVKVTPAHSTHDYEVGIRHNLPHITILDEEGNLSMSEFEVSVYLCCRLIRQSKNVLFLHFNLASLKNVTKIDIIGSSSSILMI